LVIHAVAMSKGCVFLPEFMQIMEKLDKACHDFDHEKTIIVGRMREVRPLSGVGVLVSCGFMSDHASYLGSSFIAG